MYVNLLKGELTIHFVKKKLTFRKAGLDHIDILFKMLSSDNNMYLAATPL